MNMQSLTSQAQETWQAIAAASVVDRPRLYWKWCENVVTVQKRLPLAVKDAASLLLWPESLNGLQGLGDVADILIVLDTAEAIVEGDAYIGVPDKEERDWADVTARIKRHTSGTNRPD